MSKIFISHKQEDEETAMYVMEQLQDLQMEAYLDLLDGDLLYNGEQLTAHIKEKLNSCTDILVVMSKKTQRSWWVPFEIGMAAQKDFPIVTYLVDDIQLPDYLLYWPKLSRAGDLRKYVQAMYQTVLESTSLSKGFFSSYGKSQTQRFYDRLNRELKK